MTYYTETGTKHRYKKTCTTGFLHGVEQCSNPYQISLPEKIGIELHDTPAGNQYRVYGTGFWILDSVSWALLIQLLLLLLKQPIILVTIIIIIIIILTIKHKFCSN